ncbi:DNA translocase FtsK [[Flavobacterium] thermophilum]|nr:DNA translocase FtsK [[Flavobacterium] thermophilum]
MLTDIKTNYKTWQIDKIDEELLMKIFNSKLTGVWGVEYNGRDLCLITPPYIRIQEAANNCTFENLPSTSYSIRLAFPTFLPLLHDQTIQLFSKLQGKPIFIQFLFKKANQNQMFNILDQYEDYLNGLDSPSYNKWIRKGQKKVISFLERFTEIEQRERILEAEEKILSCCYFFNIRLFVDEDISTIQTIFNKLSYYNEFVIEKEPNLHQLTTNRIFDNTYRQILSEHEIKALLCDEISKTIEQKQETETIEIISTHQSAIQLLPIGQKMERQLDEELIYEIPKALQKAKVIKDHKIEIIDTELGATVQRVTFKIPKGLVYSDIKRRYEDIKAAMATDLSIIQGNEPNTITFLIPCKQRDIIYLKTILENHDFIKFAEENPLPFTCGIDMYNQPVFKCLTKAPHLLIAGATNSGKSIFVNALLITLILLRSPKELKMYLIDPKKVEFTQYEGVTHVEKVVTDMTEAVNTLNFLVNEMETRYELMSKAKVKNIAGYNKQHKNKLPYIVCAIDEYNDLKMQHPEVEELIERLGQKARASGIHLIICTQRPDKEVMSGVIKTNLPSRISFRLDNSNEYKTVFGTGIPYQLLGFGDGVVKYIGQTEEFIRFQAPVITLDENEEVEFFENLKRYLKGEFVPHETVIEEPPICRLKRIIADTKETRVKELQQQMGIRTAEVAELMKQLVEEGWLEKESRGYKIIANEEELSKWKTH